MRAPSERTAVERCRVRSAEKGEFGSVMPILLVRVRWGRAIGRVCKPEVAGSSPARSINPCKTDDLLSAPNEVAASTASPASVLRPQKPACGHKFPVVDLPAEEDRRSVRCQSDNDVFAGTFVRVGNKPAAHPAHIPREPAVTHHHRRDGDNKRGRARARPKPQRRVSRPARWVGRGRASPSQR